MAKLFEEIFYLYRENIIAIYGLGRQTKELLEQAGDKFQIAGVLDGYCTDGEMYGMPVLSMEELIAKKVTVIIVAARPSSREIIKKRISEFCIEHDIKVLDVDGNDLSVSRSEKSISVTIGNDKREMIGQIDNHEVISFDIFDTLLMRKTLYPSDVFEIVERNLPDDFQEKLSFSKERQLAERELSRESVPTFNEIYEYLGRKNKLSKSEVQRLKEIEWETEKQLIIPRREMCDLLRYVVEQGKKVYLVSDMYFSVQQIEELLRNSGITGYEKLLISCEYRETKTEGLFGCLREEIGMSSILHIGDSKEADVDSAVKYGIDGIRIFSAWDMLKKSGLSDMLDRQDVLEDRIKLGMFMARLFNSPFCPEMGSMAIREPEDFGYLLFAPMITDFTIWLWQRVRESKEETVLFGARDGFLIKQLFDELQERAGRVAESVYFLTSRMSAVLAGIRSEDDVNYAVNMGFSGSLKEMLKTRFLLTEEEIESEDYKVAILNKAYEKRMNYLNYIKKLDLKKGRKAFFDFVSTGTCQLALEKLLGEELEGYYFMRIQEEYEEKKQLQIQEFYSLCRVEDKDNIYRDYLILENILTSLKPSLQEFDRNGEACYLPEERSEDEISFLGKMHLGIGEYFREYLEIWMNKKENEGLKWGNLKCNIKLSETILGLIHAIPVKNERFMEMQWKDGFYGRVVKVSEMI